MLDLYYGALKNKIKTNFIVLFNKEFNFSDCDFGIQFNYRTAVSIAKEEILPKEYDLKPYSYIKSKCNTIVNIIIESKRKFSYEILIKNEQ